jgi:acetaldehyde dehydrogenase (acetylating)
VYFLKKLKIAILGSGNIGTDLLIKALRSPYLECSLFIGRKLDSPGMAKAISLGVPISDLSIDAIIENPECCDLVFDATSAMAHVKHASVLEKLGKKVIDMTPSQIGKMCIPAVNINECINYQNVNMVTCGGQASVPLTYALGQIYSDIDYIEVISSIASRSAGPATRANLDEYIETTEKAIRIFSGCKRSKAILNINPAQPCINMQTTIFAKIKDPDILKIASQIELMVKTIQKYVPGYELLVSPTIENERVAIMMRIKGLGDYLPSYAGNLDIINCAAICMAEQYANYMIKQRNVG